MLSRLVDYILELHFKVKGFSIFLSTLQVNSLQLVLPRLVDVFLPFDFGAQLVVFQSP